LRYWRDKVLHSKVNRWGCGVRAWVGSIWRGLTEKRKRWGREYCGMRKREMFWKWRDERRVRRNFVADRLETRQAMQRERWEKWCMELKTTEGWECLVREGTP
jgi:hypothetical protein